MRDSVRVEVSYGRGEYIRAVRLYLRRSGIASGWDLLASLVLSAVVGGLVWLFGMTLMNTALVVLMVMAYGVGFYLYFAQPGRTYDRSKQLHSAVTYTFTPEDIGMRSGEELGTAPWNVARFWNTEEFYFLLERKYRYTILPKRVFAGAEERAFFETLVLEANPGVRYKEYR